MVRNPADMIMLADSKAQKVGYAWEANLDPTQDSQWPSNRHNRYTDIMYADGHAQSSRRKDVIDPKNLQWRARWNNDNLPHNPGSGSGSVPDWAVNWSQEAKIDR
jgi:prepilin-type processing-associated H-X9-DG protein